MHCNIVSKNMKPVADLFGLSSVCYVFVPGSSSGNSVAHVTHFMKLCNNSRFLYIVLQFSFVTMILWVAIICKYCYIMSLEKLILHIRPVIKYNAVLQEHIYVMDCVLLQSI